MVTLEWRVSNFSEFFLEGLDCKVSFGDDSRHCGALSDALNHSSQPFWCTPRGTINCVSTIFLFDELLA